MILRSGCLLREPRRTGGAIGGAGYPRLSIDRGVAQRLAARCERVLHAVSQLRRAGSAGALLFLRKRGSDRAAGTDSANLQEFRDGIKQLSQRHFISFHFVGYDYT